MGPRFTQTCVECKLKRHTCCRRTANDGVSVQGHQRPFKCARRKTLEPSQWPRAQHCRTVGQAAAKPCLIPAGAVIGPSMAWTALLGTTDGSSSKKKPAPGNIDVRRLAGNFYRVALPCCRRCLQWEENHSSTFFTRPRLCNSIPLVITTLVVSDGPAFARGDHCRQLGRDLLLRSLRNEVSQLGCNPADVDHPVFMKFLIYAEAKLGLGSGIQ